MELARREGATRGELHWHALHFMRRYYEHRQIAPDARFVIEIAGMRKARAWSAGQDASSSAWLGRFMACLA